MKNKKENPAGRGNVFIILGLLLVAAALALCIYNIWDDNRAGKDMNEALTVVHEKIEVPELNDEEVPDYVLNPKMDMPRETVGAYDYIGVVKIESRGLELPVISDWTYPALKVAPCRFSGSVYTKDMIIAGHNYNSHFKKIRNLNVGEAVVFTDMAGNEFYYEVVEREVVSGVKIEEMTAGEWDLTLFTCAPDNSKRVAIRCEEVER